jgi:ABC-type antimicrobial peptide transport system permease subunit
MASTADDEAAAALAPVIRAAVREVNPNQPLARIQTYDEILSRSLAPRRFNALLAGVFALAALALAAVGTYGVLAYSVGCRTRELGVRAALGASPSDLGRLVARQGGLLAAGALALGGSAAWLLSRGMTALLFGVQPGDPRTLALASAVLATVATVAIWLPARRATAADPNAALREP